MFARRPPAHSGGVIRNVVVHMNNEQPLLADLRALPTASDACLVCTNVRYLNGKKPTFIDAIDSWFLFPLPIVRFVEVPASAIIASEDDDVLALPMGAIADPEPLPDDGFDLEEGNALLRRMRDV